MGTRRFPNPNRLCRGQIPTLFVLLVLVAACTQAAETTSVPTPTAMAPALTPGPTTCTPAPQRTVETVWPQLQEVQPVSVTPGSEVQVIASGGYLRWDDGCTQGYDESARSFSLYLDDRQVGSISCYVNRCEGKVSLPADVALGEHVVSVEGGSSLTLQITAEGK